MLITRHNVAGILLIAATALSVQRAAVLAVNGKPSQPGRLLLYRGGRLASVTPDGQAFTWHSREWKRGQDDLYPYFFRLAPDGKRIAYGILEIPISMPESKGIAEWATLYVRGLDEVEPGIPMGSKGVSWCWSSDGRQLAVGWIERPGGKPETHNCLIDVGAKSKTELKLPPGHLVTDWSADAKWFLTKSPYYIQPAEEMPRITLMKRDGSGSRRLNDPEQAAIEGRFSPDGHNVLFATFNYLDRKGRLYVGDLTGGQPRQVSPELNAEVLGACWSPDGERIASTWRRNYVDPVPDQKAEYLLIIMERNGANPVTVLKETRSMPADVNAPTPTNWTTLFGLDWR